MKLLFFVLALTLGVSSSRAEENTCVSSATMSAAQFANLALEENSRAVERQEAEDGKHWNTGRAFAKTGKYEQAKESFELGRETKSSEYEFMLAHLESLQGRTEKAVKAYSALLPGSSEQERKQVDRYYRADPAMRQAVLESGFYPIGTAIALLSLAIIVLQLSMISIVKGRAWISLGIFAADVVAFFAQPQSDDAVTIAHLICSTCAAIQSVVFWQQRRQIWSILFASIALLFNPVLKVKLETATWNWVYLTVYLFVLISIPITSANRHEITRVFKSPFKVGVIAGIALLCASTFAFFSLNHNLDKFELGVDSPEPVRQFTESKITEDKPVLFRAAEEKQIKAARSKKYGRFVQTFDGFDVYGAQLRSEYGLSYVEGTIVNATGSVVHYVEVKADLEDASDRIIESSYTNLSSSFEPNTAWRFKIDFIDGAKARSFRIRDITHKGQM